MTEFLYEFATIIRDEIIKKKEWDEDILQPINKWFLIKILPYFFGILIINFFLTIAAVSLVICVYFRPLKN